MNSLIIRNARVRTQPQLVDILELQPQGPGLQPQPAGDVGQPRQAGSLQGQPEALAKFGEAAAVAVMAGHHRQAGQAALGGFRLQDRFHPARRRVKTYCATAAQKASGRAARLNHSTTSPRLIAVKRVPTTQPT